MYIKFSEPFFTYIYIVFLNIYIVQHNHKDSIHLRCVFKNGVDELHRHVYRVASMWEEMLCSLCDRIFYNMRFDWLETASFAIRKGQLGEVWKKVTWQQIKNVKKGLGKPTAISRLNLMMPFRNHLPNSSFWNISSFMWNFWVRGTDCNKQTAPVQEVW